MDYYSILLNFRKVKVRGGATSPGGRHCKNSSLGDEFLLVPLPARPSEGVPTMHFFYDETVYELHVGSFSKLDIKKQLHLSTQVPADATVLFMYSSLTNPVYAFGSREQDLVRNSRSAFADISIMHAIVCQRQSAPISPQ